MKFSNRDITDDKELLDKLLVLVKETDVNEVDESKAVINSPLGAELLASYKDNPQWLMRQRLMPLLEERIFGEEVNIRDLNYVRTNEELCLNIYRRFMEKYEAIASRVQQWISTQDNEYTITQHFSKKFSVTGCSNVRKVVNSPVPNTYVLKNGPQDLTVALYNGDEPPTKAGDFTRVAIWVNDHKELAMTIRHKYNQAKASVSRNLIDKCERGELRQSPSFKFDCFMTEQDWDDAVKLTMMTCKEKTYNLISYGNTGWRTLQVLDQEETKDKEKYLNTTLEIIVGNVSFSKARELYSKVGAVENCNAALKNLMVTKTRLEKELASITSRISEETSLLAEERMTLATSLDNNTWGVGVKEKVEQHLNAQQ